jgi:hypothetical protein
MTLMKRTTIIIALTLALVLGVWSCGKDKKKRRGAASSPASAGATAPAEVPSVEGVPDYENKAVASKIVTKSQKHNSKAVKHHLKKRYKKAERGYLKALKLNPRYEMARYNLACAYALMGEHDKSLGLLSQLKAAGCYRCLERVIRAQTDTDFASLHQDRRFQRITGGIMLPSLNFKQAAKRLSSKFKIANFQPTFDDGRVIRIVSVSTHRDNYSKYYDVKNQKELNYRLKKMFDVHWYEQEMEVKYPLPWLIDTKVPQWSCTKNCCTAEGEFYCSEGGPALLNKVCFEPLSAVRLLPIKLVFDNCSG